MKKLLLLLWVASRISVSAQTIFHVSDSMPALSEGLSFGYAITGQSEKEVGSKGDFSRYKIRFFISNPSTQAKILLHRPGSGLLVSTTSPDLVQFKCLNATGARFTVKEATLQARPCIMEAIVEDKDCATGKTVQNKRPVNIGYWIRPGETITGNSIVIVPLNEKPDMTATLFPINNAPVVSTFGSGGNDYAYAGQQQPYVRIRNLAGNIYLNSQNGPATCTSINADWWGAQWELVPVSGTRYYLIRNRLRNNFISIDNASMVSDNGQSAGARWIIEETATANTVTIQNAASHAKLVWQNDGLTTTNAWQVSSNAQWILER